MMISYAQNFEDVLLARCFRGQETGFYVDAGAWEPTYDSVTKHFYDRGWHGINIEPDRRGFEKLVRDRARDINLNVALGARSGTRDFHIVGTGGLSTLNTDHLERFKQDLGFSHETVRMPVLTLAKVCKSHGVGDIDFLKIDVEGSEAEVLRGADWKQWRPRVIVIEATQPARPEPAWEAWEPYLLKQNYRFVLFDGLNRFYVRNEEPHLAVFLTVPANSFDDFEQHRVVELRAAVEAAEANHARDAEALRAELEHERAMHRQDVQRQGDEVTFAQGMVRTYELETERLRRELEGLRESRQEALETLRLEMEREHSAHRQAVHKLDQEVSHARGMAHTFEREAERLRREWGAGVESHRSEIAALRRELVEAQQATEKVRCEAERLALALAAASSAHQAEAEGLRAELAAARLAGEQAGREVQTLTAELAAHAAAHQIEADGLRARLAEARQEVATGARESERLAAELAEARQGFEAERALLRDRLQAAQDAQRTQSTTLQSELAAERTARAAETGGLHAELAAARQEHEHRNAAQAQAQEQLRQSLQVARADVERLQRRFINPGALMQFRRVLLLLPLDLMLSFAAALAALALVKWSLPTPVMAAGEILGTAGGFAVVTVLGLIGLHSYAQDFWLGTRRDLVRLGAATLLAGFVALPVAQMLQRPTFLPAVSMPLGALLAAVLLAAPRLAFRVRHGYRPHPGWYRVLAKTTVLAVPFAVVTALDVRWGDWPVDPPLTALRLLMLLAVGAAVFGLHHLAERRFWRIPRATGRRTVLAGAIVAGYLALNFVFLPPPTHHVAVPPVLWLLTVLLLHGLRRVGDLAPTLYRRARQAGARRRQAARMPSVPIPTPAPLQFGGTLADTTPDTHFDATLVGKVNASNGIGLHTVAFLEALRGALTLNVINTRVAESNFTDLTPDAREIVRRGFANCIPGDVTIYTDVLWNGTGDVNHRKVPNSPIRWAYSTFDSTQVPEEWARIINECFDGVLVADAHLTASYRHSGVRRPIVALPLYLPDLTDFLSTSLKREPNRPFVFGCVASYLQRKNLETLVEAFQAAFADRPEAVVLRIHSGLNFGGYFEAFQAFLKERGATNVVATCHELTRAEYVALFGSFDAYALISKGEGYSITPREAFALGLPAVLTDVLAQRTICAEGLAVTVPAEQEEPAIYEAIEGRHLGSQFGCRAEDVRAALRDVFERYGIHLGQAEARRAWAARFAGEELRDQYRTVVRPEAVALSDTNAIENGRLTTTSVELVRKYQRVESRRLLAAGRPRRRKLVVIGHDGGFYSVFNAYLSHLAWSLGHAGVEAVLPDWRIRRMQRYLGTTTFTSWCYGTEADGNIWLKLFEPVPHAGLPEEAYHDECRLYEDAEVARPMYNEFQEPLLTYKHAYRLYRMPEFQQWREWYHEAYEQNVFPRESIRQRVCRVHQEALAGFYVLGVHVRHPSHAIEQPDLALPTVERCFARVDAHLGELSRSNRNRARIFLATDQELNVDLFRARYGDRVVALGDVARTTQEQDAQYASLPQHEQLKEAHQVQHRAAANQALWSTRMAEDVIVDAMLLARCDALFHITSNIATAVSFMNPGVRMIQYDEA